MARVEIFGCSCQKYYSVLDGTGVFVTRWGVVLLGRSSPNKTVAKRFSDGRGAKRSGQSPCRVHQITQADGVATLMRHMQRPWRGGYATQHDSSQRRGHAECVPTPQWPMCVQGVATPIALRLAQGFLAHSEAERPKPTPCVASFLIDSLLDCKWGGTTTPPIWCVVRCATTFFGKKY